MKPNLLIEFFLQPRHVYLKVCGNNPSRKNTIICIYLLSLLKNHCNRNFEKRERNLYLAICGLQQIGKFFI